MIPSGDLDKKLDGLFAAYREAVPDRDASANFMPELWGRIDGRRRAALSFRRLSRIFVTSAAVASLALGVLVLAPRSADSVVYQSTYIEILTDAPAVDQVAEISDAGDTVETDLI